MLDPNEEPDRKPQCDCEDPECIGGAIMASRIQVMTSDAGEKFLSLPDTLRLLHHVLEYGQDVVDAALECAPPDAVTPIETSGVIATHTLERSFGVLEMVLTSNVTHIHPLPTTVPDEVPAWLT